MYETLINSPGLPNSVKANAYKQLGKSKYFKILIRVLYLQFANLGYLWYSFHREPNDQKIPDRFLLIEKPMTTMSKKFLCVLTVFSIQDGCIITRIILATEQVECRRLYSCYRRP
jgi:hypothetical protein